APWLPTHQMPMRANIATDDELNCCAPITVSTCRKTRLASSWRENDAVERPSGYRLEAINLHFLNRRAGS
ncbi:MAG: hypothetical protein P8Y67_13920, partial [Alphaproteobacteria bacterium]